VAADASVGGSRYGFLADTYAGINPAAVQRQIQVLTTEQLTITTSKARPRTKATIATPATRASVD